MADDDWDGARTPPHDMLAEQSVLGSMMLKRDVVEDVMAVITPADFYLPKHETVALAIGALFRRDEPTDVIAVSDELTRGGMLQRAGGAEYLHTLTGIPTTPSAFHASIVRDRAHRRRMIEGGTRLVQMGYATEGDVDDLVENARAELDQVTAVKSGKVRMIGETLTDLAESLDAKAHYLPTPWESIDHLIGGFAPGNLYIVGARPGDGKSIVLLQAALGLAKHGMIAFSSLEMTERELQLRMVAQYGEIHMTNLRNHDLSDIQWRMFADVREAVLKAPLFVDETPAVSIAAIRAHARAVARRGELMGIFVDYLQLVSSEGPDRRLAVDAVSRSLKQLAKDFQVPVIAAAQLKRIAPTRGSRPMPTLSDLREAGGIEQDADVVMLLHRDPEKKPSDVQVIVAKNRHGAEGRVTLQWQAQYARVRDKKWSPTALIEDVE